jgi:hypothetical protein
MLEYEVWSREELARGSDKPEAVFYTLDAAINLAKKLARGQTVKKTWKLAPGANPYSGWFGAMNGEYVDVVVPKMYAVIERDKQSKVRGWAKDGQYMIVVDCKRCNDSGEDGDKVCSSCHGASYKPSV